MVLSAYPPLPSLKLLKTRLTELSQLDLRYASVDFLVSRLKPVVSGLSFNVFTFDPGRIVYRGRICATPPVHANEVGLPPAHLSTRYGRLNRPGAPVLYTNMAAGSVFRELRAEPGQTIALASYQVICPFFAMASGLDASAVQSRGWGRKVEPWPAGDRGKEVMEISLTLNRFLARQFVREVVDKEDYLYKLSIAWAEIALSAKQIDSVVYPSVANAAISDNLAFRATSVTDLLELVRVDFVRVDGYSHGVTHMTFLHAGDVIGSDGVLAYREVKPMLVHDLSRMTSDISFQLEGRKWTMTAPNGNLIASEDD